MSIATNTVVEMIEAPSSGSTRSGRFEVWLPTLFAAVMLTIAAPAQAQTAPVVQNGSFEADFVANGQNSIRGKAFPGITGWSIVDPMNSTVELGGFWKAQDGRNALYLANAGNNSLPAYIRTYVNGFVRGWTYSLNFWMSADPASDYGNLKTLTATLGWTGLNGVGTGATRQFVFDVNKQVPAKATPGIDTNNMGWEQKSLTFTYDSNYSNVDLSFTNNENYQSGGGVTRLNYQGPLIDNVSFSIVATPGPEAGAGLSMLASVIGLAFWRRRRAVVAA